MTKISLSIISSIAIWMYMLCSNFPQVDSERTINARNVTDTIQNLEPPDFDRHCKKACDQDSNCRGQKRVCQYDNICGWSCAKASTRKCKRLKKIPNGSVNLSLKHTLGAMATYKCNKGYTLHGPAERKCQSNGYWSGYPPSCRIVDCGDPKHFPNGYFVYDKSGHTTYGSSTKYKCFRSASFSEEDYHISICQADGHWTSVPPCMAKCKLQGKIHDIINGNVEEGYIRHNSSIEYTCHRGFQKQKEDISVCYNGTWTSPPACEPKSCSKPPKEIQNGTVKIKSNMVHGTKARYRCSPSFQMMNNSYVTCLYGNWNGTLPVCKPIPCKYPGTINHGKILLVGVIGKYEYRPYVKKIKQGDKIEYHCNHGYKIEGHAVATCSINGWHPAEKPICVLEDQEKFRI